MRDNDREIYRRLADKYDLGNVPWYIEYPHKSFWSETFSEQNYTLAIRELAKNEHNPAVLLYLHIPFCQEMCYFCVCHFHITHNYERVRAYMTYLYKEMALLKNFCEKESISLNFQEIHLGGGSPTYLKEEEFEELLVQLRGLVNMGQLREFAIEIDPRRVDKDRLKFYKSQGVNRISFGIQDFDPNVQKLINRIQPKELMDSLLTPDIRSLFENGINFDIICGLPGQTQDSFRSTIEKVIELSPDKVSLTFMSYSPENHKHQKLMLREGPIPDLYEQKVLFLEALELLSANGYVRMGYDHFAKSSDPVAQARQQRKMAWNSFGFTPGVCTNFIGLGVHSYSIIGPYYSQSTYDQKKYESSINRGQFPIFRGHALTNDDLMRREIIHQLRGYFNLKFKEVENIYNINFSEYFKVELKTLHQISKDGLVDINSEGIFITNLGQQFANVICSVFDTYLKK